MGLSGVYKTMKQLFSLLLIGCFISCEIKSNQNVPEYKPSTPQIDNIQIEVPETNHKFVFVTIITKEPRLNYKPATYINQTYFDEIAFVEWDKYIHYSEIEEYTDFTEDDGYKLMDKAKKDIISKYRSYPYDVIQNVQNPLKEEELLSHKVTVLSSEYFEFDSYKDASVRKNEIMNSNEKSENY